MASPDLSAPDLTQRPPRSPRCLLGGYALLPRMLDKGRAELAGRCGEYKFGCPLDQRWLSFAGIELEALREELAGGAGDGAILKWIEAKGRRPREAWEIAAWSRHELERAPADLETREFFHGLHQSMGPEREDIATWAEILDLDDFVSFGGKA